MREISKKVFKRRIKKEDLLNKLNNYKGMCKRAPATLCLLKIAWGGDIVFFLHFIHSHCAYYPLELIMSNKGATEFVSVFNFVIAFTDWAMRHRL